MTVVWEGRRRPVVSIMDRIKGSEKCPIKCRSALESRECASAIRVKDTLILAGNKLCKDKKQIGIKTDQN